MTRRAQDNTKALDAFIAKKACVDAARFARKTMNLRACDRVRACVRPALCGLPSAAGRYGDLRIGPKSEMRARSSRLLSGCSNPDLLDRFARTVPCLPHNSCDRGLSQCSLAVTPSVAV